MQVLSLYIVSFVFVEFQTIRQPDQLSLCLTVS